MGKLEQALVQRLVETSPGWKRDEMEEIIRQLLGAEAFTQVTGLAARRGAADGGFDGVMTVSYLHNEQWSEKIAGLNVKVRSSKFTREQLGGFLLDMDRENIDLGFIITAAGLTPDAQSEIMRKNEQGSVYLVPIELEDILSSSTELPNIKIQGKSLNTVLTDNLKSILEQGDKKA